VSSHTFYAGTTNTITLETVDSDAIGNLTTRSNDLELQVTSGAHLCVFVWVHVCVLVAWVVLDQSRFHGNT
jgi:hypothetical protein